MFERHATSYARGAPLPIRETPHKAGNGELTITCRNSHCPKCQAQLREQWLAARERELLTTTYFHVVFTVPHELNVLALGNPRLFYDLLFAASAQTLLKVAADPKHLGAEIGLISILHTWGQNLLLHPHVHCAIPAGGLSPDHKRWIRPQYPFFLPVKVLGRIFRGKFCAGLKRLYRNHRYSNAQAKLPPWHCPNSSTNCCAGCTGTTGWSTLNPCSAAPLRSSVTWVDIHTGSRSPTIEFSAFDGNASHSDGRITRTGASSGR